MAMVCPSFRDRDDATCGLCWAVSIKDHSWPMFCLPKLLWDTPTSVFMMFWQSSTAIFESDYTMNVQDHPHWEEMRMEFQSTIYGLISVRSGCLVGLQCCGWVGTFLSSNGAAAHLLIPIQQGRYILFFSITGWIAGEYQQAVAYVGSLNNRLNPFWNLDRFPPQTAASNLFETSIDLPSPQKPQMPLKHGLVSPKKKWQPEFFLSPPSIMCLPSFSFLFFLKKNSDPPLYLPPKSRFIQPA